jgi:N,N'-diacetyllegionaminate synthase
MVKFGERCVGDGAPCFITFEAGATHDGLESASRLVNMAASAGADAIKFQIFDPDRLVADKHLMFSYEVLVERETGKTELVTEPLYDILCRRYLSAEEWRQVKQLSDEKQLAFFATVGFEEDIELLVKLGCDSIKIASADVNHFPLIRQAARTGMCIQIDTGNATIGEVEAAIDVIQTEGNDGIIIHHCPSGYPAHLESINLNIIPSLKRLFPFPIAFSDHTPGWEMDIAAIALGANLLEKTITEDRLTRSVEHVFSLEPQDMSLFIKRIRQMEIALGSNRRILHQAEREKRARIRRGVYLREPVRMGRKVGEAAVEFRRPGFGIGPDLYESLLGYTFRKDFPSGHMLRFEDIAHEA